jgi:hypothetical protein
MAWVFFTALISVLGDKTSDVPEKPLLLLAVRNAHCMLRIGRTGERLPI